MSEKKYVQLIDSIRASDSAVEKAVNSIYEDKCAENISSFKPKKKIYFKLASATAAVLVLALFIGIFSFSFGNNSENSFTVKVSAAEINAFDSVEIGELKGNGNSRKICFDENNKAYYIIQSKDVDFPVLCSGKNIDKINYKINGNGYFALRENISDISDIVNVEDKPSSFIEAEMYPYDVATVEGSTEKALSYTVDYETQAESKAVLVLYVLDDNGKYCNSYNENVQYNESENTKIYGKHFDYENIYYNLFNDGNYSIDITVIYKDGTTETKTLKLSLEKTLKPYEDGSENEDEKNYTLLTVNASLATE